MILSNSIRFLKLPFFSKLLDKNKTQLIDSLNRNIIQYWSVLVSSLMTEASLSVRWFDCLQNASFLHCATRDSFFGSFYIFPVLTPSGMYSYRYLFPLFCGWLWMRRRIAHSLQPLLGCLSNINECMAPLYLNFWWQ